MYHHNNPPDWIVKGNSSQPTTTPPQQRGGSDYNKSPFLHSPSPLKTRSLHAREPSGRETGQEYFREKFAGVLPKFVLFFRTLQQKEMKDFIVAQPPQRADGDEKKIRKGAAESTTKTPNRIKKEKQIVPTDKRKGIARKKVRPHAKFVYRKHQPTENQVDLMQPEQPRPKIPQSLKRERDTIVDGTEDIDEIDEFVFFSSASPSTTNNNALLESSYNRPRWDQHKTALDTKDEDDDEEDDELTEDDDDDDHPVRSTSSSSAVKNVEIVRGIADAIEALGGKAKGSDVTNWISQNQRELCSGDKKILSYRVNAVLSSKKHANIFGKIKNPSEQNRRKTVWYLKKRSNLLGPSDHIEHDQDHDQDPMDEDDAMMNSDAETEEDTSDVEGEDEGDFTLPSPKLVKRPKGRPKGSTKKAKEERERARLLSLSMPMDTAAGPSEYVGCQICRQQDKEDKILLCDGCDKEYHMFCLDPPLSKVPKGNWFCSSCLGKDAAYRYAADSPRFHPKRKTDLEYLEVFSNVSHIEEVLKTLGGTASGSEIAHYIMTQNNVPETMRKTLQYRVNALLAGKPQFFKETVLVDGNRRASMWKFIDLKNPNSEFNFQVENQVENKEWSDEEITALATGVEQFGFGSWSEILATYPLLSSYSISQIRAKYIEKFGPPNQEEAKNCEICHKIENEECTLLCDGCDREFHTYCLDPPVPEIPKGAWYCNQCAEYKRASAPKPPRATKVQVNHEVVKQVKMALQQLGGVATGDQVATYLTNNGLMPPTLKANKYKVNAILSSKSYNMIFEKNQIVLDGVKKAAVWRLRGKKVGEAISEDEDNGHLNLQVENQVENQVEKPIEHPEDMEESYFDEPSEETNDALNPVCAICKENDDTELLMCDGHCGKEYHLYCVDPPLSKIPKGKWFCPTCMEKSRKIQDQDHEMIRREEKKRTSERRDRERTEKKKTDMIFVNQVKEALISLGKPSTGAEVAQRLYERGIMSQDDRQFRFRVLAILSCKSYAPMFEKTFQTEGSKTVGLWTVKGNSDKIPDKSPEKMPENNNPDPENIPEISEEIVDEVSETPKMSLEATETIEDEEAEVDENSLRIQLETFSIPGNSVCTICGINQPCVRTSHVDNMSAYFSWEVGITFNLSKSDPICHKCYTMWFNANHQVLGDSFPCEEKSRKKNKYNRHQISSREVRMMQTKADPGVDNIPPEKFVCSSCNSSKPQPGPRCKRCKNSYHDFCRAMSDDGTMCIECVEQVKREAPFKEKFILRADYPKTTVALTSPDERGNKLKVRIGNAGEENKVVEEESKKKKR